MCWGHQDVVPDAGQQNTRKKMDIENGKKMGKHEAKKWLKNALELGLK